MKRIQAPYWWNNASRAARFFLASLILNFSTSDMYSPSKTKLLIFWMGTVLLFIQTLDIFTDVKKVKGDDKEVEIPEIKKKSDE